MRMQRGLVCAYGHPFDETNTYRRPDGKGKQCRTCNRRRERGEPAGLRIAFTHCVNGHDLREVGTLANRPTTCRQCHRHTQERENSVRMRRAADARATRAQLDTARQRDDEGRWLYCNRGLHRLDDPANVRLKADRRGEYRVCQPCWLESRRAHRAAQRAQVIEAYGDACRCCGETWGPFLHLDHVNSDGATHRRSLTDRNLVRWAIANGYPDTLQILCANCNLAKEHGGCPPSHAGRVAAGTACVDAPSAEPHA